ncbi:MAG: 30S ribosome-binding factor RbfA [Magnetovibrio sp.]|nr:30S ribosome-binding factor RbfA [Magnetovibrio sp.]
MARHGQHVSAKGPSQRQLRVGEEVRHALVQVLERNDLREPLLMKTSITVTEVSVSPDLKNATCFVMPLGGGDEESVHDVIVALARAAKFLRFEIANSTKLKHTPALRFMHDTSFDDAGHIDKLLHQPEVARDLVKPDVDGADGNGANDGDEGDEEE